MSYVIGLDYGTDSCRAVLVDTNDGTCLATAVHAYQRWARGEFCDPANEQFRQHPLDYIEGLTSVVGEILKAQPEAAAQIKGIGIDTTGSTPIAVAADGEVLALKPAFADNPNAMFILWKDHTALAESDKINALAHSDGFEDYTRYSGGIHSPEWFWAKAAHILASDSAVAAATDSFIEHGDWLPALLAGINDAKLIKRSRCLAGHKAMWHADWNGYPSDAFLTALEPKLAGMRERMDQTTYTMEQQAGTLCAEWAEKLGLPTGIAIAVGALDAHIGAVGANIKPGMWCKVMGTSTCDMVVSKYADIGDTIIPGICGQVDGSILSGAIGLEAGQAAFGDVYAWFKSLLLWPIKAMGVETSEEHYENLLVALGKEAACIPIGADGVTALDWFNGRRTPDVNPNVKAAISGIKLGTDAPRLYRALVEATIFGSKSIYDRMAAHGVNVKRIVALGGIAQKSAFVMQCMADVLDCEIVVSASEQTCALGAAMYASVAAGLCDTIDQAGNKLDAGICATYTPNPANKAAYAAAYAKYQTLAAFAES